MPMEQTDYSLQELADLIGVEKRTIRSWIEQGLLKGPETVGRNARYGRGHLERLKAIKVLRDHYGMSLSDARQELLLATDERVRELAQRIEGSGPEPITTETGHSSALAYIRAVQSSASNREEKAPVSAQTGVSRLLSRLEAGGSEKPPPRKAHGEAWFRITVTPDVELAVRGALDPDRLARIERVADYLREILLGGKDDYGK